LITTILFHIHSNLSFNCPHEKVQEMLSMEEQSLLGSISNSAALTVIALHGNCTLLHDTDLILSNISQTAALTTNSAATAASPNELTPKLLAQVGTAAVS
jgi:hypothetical protein